MKNKSRFINAIEIIYSLLLAVGLYDATINLSRKDPIELLFNLLFVGLCVLILIRFFFAPSKNIALVIKNISNSTLSPKERNKKYRYVMLVDIPILFLHAIIYILICKCLDGIYVLINCQMFFTWFAILLILNGSWLTHIKERLEKMGKKCPPYIKFWAQNNVYSFLGIYFFLVLSFLTLDFDSKCFFEFKWQYIYMIVLLILAYLNCYIDLLKTYKAYFSSKILS